MKNLKRVISVVLLVCILCSSTVLISFAAENNTRANFAVTCQVDGTNFRRLPDTTSEVIGNLMSGDVLNVSNTSNPKWYGGTPNIGTAIYNQFGAIFGYSMRYFFNIT